MKRLISLLEYVKRFDKPTGFYADQLDYYEGQSNAMNYVTSYANFLSLKLSLEMFVPCKLVEGVWVVLEEPMFYKRWLDNKNRYPYSDDAHLKCKEYQEAKDRVLFDGFEKIITNNSGSFKVMNGGFQVYYYKSIPDYCLWLGSQKEKTIEDLVKYNLELTPTAKKQIGWK